jgi:hypothetical protein
MKNTKQFIAFLESMNNDKNATFITAAKSAFKVCFENVNLPSYEVEFDKSEGNHGAFSVIFYDRELINEMINKLVAGDPNITEEMKLKQLPISS